MNVFILSFYILSIVSYFLILILPAQNRFLFSTLILCAIFFLIYHLVYKNFRSILTTVRSIPFSYFLILIIYVAIGVYGMYLRWIAEPYGMWDAWAIWNLKAKSIANEFLFGNQVNFANEYWPHKDYPLGLPLVHSSIAILVGGWSEWISYGIQIVFFVAIGFVFLLHSHSKKLHYIYLILPLLILAMNSQVLTIASDLCAEMALSCFLIIIYYSLIRESETDLKNDSYSGAVNYGLIFAAPLIVKNEGIIYVGGILFLYSIFYILSGKFTDRTKSMRIKNLLYTLLPTLVLALLLVYWKYKGNQLIPEDFNQDKAVGKLTWELILGKLSFINIYFSTFQFSMMNGIFFIAISLGLFIRKRAFVSVALHLFFILMIYHFLFIISNKDISWHLNTAYIRIHSSLIAPAIFLGWSSIIMLLTRKKEAKVKRSET
ncbi:hypothetical protein LPTSP3_g01990 [Leptospira kobayashii]|uniref:Glycosyltransferase RgtA/B/C/D-like domain-containing protein n=1 Tax=Leptospira kobayashii TaxID=1917830 RepID=A0ABN6K8M9_9LEPT|nr:hypothetical protein [Leptospira kobayashii]BDA77269.1 hypothetical protein LPTSP3_g01990 [Leptospira kobayashii]